MWSENDNYDLALSFQEKAGCDEIWEIICQVRMRLSCLICSWGIRDRKATSMVVMRKLKILVNF